MAGVKITDLPQLSVTPDNDDVLIVVDVDENVTKYVSVSTLSSAITAGESIEAQAARSIFIQDVDSDDTYFPLFSKNTPTISGASDSVKADTNFTYNPGTNTLSALFFSGNGSLLTNVLADSAAVATTALVALTTNNALTADSATNATNANTALTALNALSADSAINASNALLATVAVESLGDLDNVIDSATGARVLGDLVVDSDLTVGGILYGDGSGLINVTSTAVTTASEKTDAKPVDSSGLHYLMLRTLSTGYDSVSTTADLTYDPTTATLSASSFQGDGSNLTNVTAVNSTNAQQVSVSSVSSNTQYYLHIGSVASGNDNVNVSTDLLFNPFTNKLTTSIFSSGDWEVFENAGVLTFRHNGVNKMTLNSTGDLAIAGTLTQSATL
jgi:hypothetical protein